MFIAFPVRGSCHAFCVTDEVVMENSANAEFYFFCGLSKPVMVSIFCVSSSGRAMM